MSGLCPLLCSPHDSPASYDVTPGSVPGTTDAERNREDCWPEAYHEFMHPPHHQTDEVPLKMRPYLQMGFLQVSSSKRRS